MLDIAANSEKEIAVSLYGFLDSYFPQLEVNFTTYSTITLSRWIDHDNYQVMVVSVLIMVEEGVFTALQTQRKTFYNIADHYGYHKFDYRDPKSVDELLACVSKMAGI